MQGSHELMCRATKPAPRAGYGMAAKYARWPDYDDHFGLGTN